MMNLSKLGLIEGMLRNFHANFRLGGMAWLLHLQSHAKHAFAGMITRP